MAIDEGLAERIRESLGAARVTEKRMFGGLAFLSRGHMFVGIAKGTLMVRVGPVAYADALTRPHAREMDFTGRPMRGFIQVSPAGVEDDDDLGGWLARGIAFAEKQHTKPMPMAKSKKRRAAKSARKTSRKK